MSLLLSLLTQTRSYNRTHSLAESSSLFASECKRLTTQMLNTVPSGVTLTEITPIAVKPVNVTLTVNSAGTVTFSGAIRVSSL